MTDSSARLSLPYLQPGQAQKELYHKEALALLDLTVQAAVQSVGLDTPPATPAIGACWVVGATPSGVWSGHAGALAGWTTGGWRFVDPAEGMTAWSIADGMWAQHIAGSWSLGALNGAALRINGTKVVGARAGAIAAQAGGTTIDAEARAAIGSLLAMLREHGLIAS